MIHKLLAFFSLAGDISEEATPDPIPNSEVKLFSVDGTAWVTVWESRSLPAFYRGVAQPGSALAWGARGRKFKSCRPDFSSKHLL